jgi:hypothetical protein
LILARWSLSPWLYTAGAPSLRLGYPSGHCDAIRSDLVSLSDIYDLDIRTAGAGHPGMCRWRYVPR